MESVSSYKVLDHILPYLTDPIFPDIQELFECLNALYFKAGLAGCVQIEWSNRMTSCAGLCSAKRIRWQDSNGYSAACHCTIRLSAPLLKYRPMEDLLDTLLHEMIHAYLFINGNNAMPESGNKVSNINTVHSRDGHGEAFQAWMHWINRLAGTRITIYHSFIAEVNQYKTHIWKCNGSCQYLPPYYGLVKRAMNRPPQPADSWYSRHKATCGGTFTKIESLEPKPNSEKNVSASLLPKVLQCPICIYRKEPLSPDIWFVSLQDLNDHMDSCSKSMDPIVVVISDED
jgi:hypothetical protein